MISVLIETRNSAAPLARTLSALVGAAVEGIVRDVIVLDHGSTDQTHRVADEAGCTFLNEGHALGDCLGRARGEWLLILEPGAQLLDGWMEAIVLHTEHFPGPARFTRSAIGARRFLPRVFVRRSGFADGLLVSRRQAAQLFKQGRSLAELAGTASVRRLPARIIPAQR
jgi:glycosyltransferase involved in cell wall biosynthesis